MAQTQGNTGQIGGATVPGAKLRVTSMDTDAVREVFTNAEGQYLAVLIPSGTYKMDVEAGGFAPAVAQGVIVTVGAGVDQDFHLVLGTVTETVTVTVPLVEVSRYEAGDTLNARAIQDLPINGRRFQDFITLTPTATIEQRHGQFSLLGQRGINTSLNVDGMDYNEPFFGGTRATQTQVFSVPQSAIAEFQVVTAGYSPEFGRSSGGVVTAITKSGTNELHGSAFYFLRQKELGLQNALNQQSLENRHQFGGSIGGRIVKNRAFYFAAFEQQCDAIPRVVQFPALIGVARTPANAEPFDLYKGAEQGYIQANDGNAALGRLDYQFRGGHLFSLRHNHGTFNAANSVTTGNQINPNINSAQSNNGIQHGLSDSLTAQWIALLSPSLANDLRFQYSRETRVRTPNAPGPTVIDTIGTFGISNFLPSDLLDQRYQAVDSLNWRHGSHAVKAGFEYNYTPAYQYFGFNQFGVFTVSGSNVATQLALLAAPPAVATNRFDSPSVRYSHQTGNLLLDFAGQEAALFLQDHWQVHPRLVLDYGLRWEGQYLPSPDTSNQAEAQSVRETAFPLGRLDPRTVPSLGKQFMPRLGLAWRPGRTERMVVRASAGVFYARTPLLVAGAPFNNFRSTPGDLSVNLPFAIPAGNPNAGINTVYKQLKLIGIDLNQSPLNQLPILSIDQIQRIPQALGIPFTPFQGSAPLTWASGFQNPRTIQLTLGTEREMVRGLSLYANFNYANTVHLTRNRDYNLPVPIIRPDDKSLRPFYGLSSGVARPDPLFGAIIARESSARSLYRGGTFGAKLVRRRFQIEAHYTVSATYSDDDNERDASISYDNSFNLRPEYSYSELDARHAFTAQGVIPLPWGVEVASIWKIRSGTPFTASTGADSNQNLDQAQPNPTDLPYRAPGVPFARNSFRNPAFYNSDLRVLKNLRLSSERVAIQISAEIFNVFNSSNVTIGSRNRVYGLGIDPVTGNAIAPPASFGRIDLPSGQIDPNNTVGSPFQFQGGIRFSF
jgi:hypothetical protein